MGAWIQFEGTIIIGSWKLTGKCPSSDWFFLVHNHINENSGTQNLFRAIILTRSATFTFSQKPLETTNGIRFGYADRIHQSRLQWQPPPTTPNVQCCDLLLIPDMSQYVLCSFWKTFGRLRNSTVWKSDFPWYRFRSHLS